MNLQELLEAAPAAFEITPPGHSEPVAVPLRYPTAAMAGEVYDVVLSMAHIDQEQGEVSVEENASSIRATHQAALLSLSACVEGDITEDQAFQLVRLSGGWDSPLVERCLQLCGLRPAEEGRGKDDPTS